MTAVPYVGHSHLAFIELYASEKELREYLNHENWLVQEAITRSRRAPYDVLMELTAHPLREVREQAEARLGLR